MSGGSEYGHEQWKFKKPCGISVVLGFSETTCKALIEFSEN